MSVTQTYTTVDLDNIACKLDNFISFSASSYAKKKLYNVGIANIQPLKLAIMYRWVLNDWSQHSNGSITGLYNYISQDELVLLVNNIKTLIG